MTGDTPDSVSRRPAAAPAELGDRGEIAWARTELAELREARAALTLSLFSGRFGWWKTAGVVSAFATAATWAASGDLFVFTVNVVQLTSLILLVRWARDSDSRRELDARIAELESELADLDTPRDTDLGADRERGDEGTRG